MISANEVLLCIAVAVVIAVGFVVAGIGDYGWRAITTGVTVAFAFRLGWAARRLDGPR